MRSAAKIIAVAALPGIPSVRSGMNDEDAAALFAASGPATPAIAPCPNSSGLFATRFSTA
jgi:hypothetical protein